MRLMVTAQITFEVYDVEGITEALAVLHDSIEAEENSRHIQFVAAVDVFATEVNAKGSFEPDPRMWEAGSLLDTPIEV